VKSCLAPFVVLLLAVSAEHLSGVEPSEAAPDLRTVAGGSVSYHLSLPPAWTATRTWPIVVTIPGSSHNFAGNFQGFVKARGDRPFIIVTPCVSSNGNDPADLPAVLAIVREVQHDFSGQPKFFMTGFSAGGHLTWQMVFTHPELLAGAALAAGNFRFRGVAEVTRAPEAATLPIQGFQGDRDPYLAGLQEQWKDATELARKSGFPKPGLTIVPGAAHQAFQEQVLTYFSRLLPK
jgi:poly(3-hydroxybutyrate) depolymerase